MAFDAFGAAVANEKHSDKFASSVDGRPRMGRLRTLVVSSRHCHRRESAEERKPCLD
jgi:hypothetical protein